MANVSSEMRMPGLTAVEKERNSRIRSGLEQPAMMDAEAREWLRLL